MKSLIRVFCSLLFTMLVLTAAHAQYPLYSTHSGTYCVGHDNSISFGVRPIDIVSSQCASGTLTVSGESAWTITGPSGWSSSQFDDQYNESYRGLNLTFLSGAAHGNWEVKVSFSFVPSGGGECSSVSGTASYIVNVALPITPVVTLSSNYSISSGTIAACQNATVTMTANMSNNDGLSGPNVTWSRYKNQGGTWQWVDDTSNGSVTYQASDFADGEAIRAKVNYSMGCDEPSAWSSQVNFDITPTTVIPVSIHMMQTNGVCTDAPIGFSIANTTGWGTGWSIKWKVNGTESSIGSSPPNLPLEWQTEHWPLTQPATVQAVVTVGEDAVCPDYYQKGSNIITVPILPPQRFSVSFTPYPSRQSMEYCPGELEFKATTSHSAGLVWYKNDLVVQTDGLTYKPGSISDTDVIKLQGTPNSLICIDMSDNSGWTFTKTVSQIGSSPYMLNIIGQSSVGNINVEDFGGPNNNIPGSGERCRGDGWTLFSIQPENYFSNTITWSFTENGGPATQNTYNPGTTLAEIGWDPNFVGTVTIKAKVQGCPGDSTTRVITVNPLIAAPSVEIVGPDWVCPQTPATFMSSTSALHPVYTWLKDGSETVTSDQPTEGPPIPPSNFHKNAWSYGGSYIDLKLKVANEEQKCSLGDGYSNTIRVWQSLSGVQIDPYDAIHCQGTDIDIPFTASPNFTDYTWYLDNAGQSHINSVTGVVDSWDSSLTGPDSAKVYVAAEGCPLIKSPPVYIKFGTNPVGVPSVSGNYRFGAGRLMLSASGAVGTESYRWFRTSDNTLKSTSQTFKTPSFSSQLTHEYYVKTVTPLGCMSAPTWVDVNVYPQVSISATPDYVMMGSKATLSTGTFDTYKWTREGTIVGTTPTLQPDIAGQYRVEVTVDGGKVGLSPPFKLKGQLDSQNLNYIVTHDANVKNITASNLLVMPVDSVSQKVEYFDGLGRPIQSVATRASPTKQDLVQQLGYDDFGRQTLQYLPVTTGDNGWMKSNIIDVNGLPMSILSSFYTNSSDNIEDDIAPYSKTLYELSELNRPVEIGSPGADFQPGTEHTRRKRYRSNTSAEVLNFLFSNGEVSYKPSAPYVPANQLSVTVDIDEQGGEVRTYTDQEGRTICKCVKAGQGEYAYTYYVFDNTGNLVTVLPPEAIKRILQEIQP